MQPRRSLRLMAGALVLALPLLSSCGFGKATDRVYTPGEGVNDRDGDVKVLNAVIVAAQPGSGTFITTLSNNSENAEDEAGLESVAGAGEDESVEVDELAEPIEIAPRSFVNLAEDGGIPVRGEFGAGDVVPLTLTFTSGETATLDVPVVFACEQYTGLDFSGGDAEATPTEGATATESTDPSAEPTTEGSALPSEEASAEASTEESYECAGASDEE